MPPRKRAWARRTALGAAGCVLGLLLVAGGVGFWYYHRPAASPITESLFEGVDRVQEVLTTPRPIVANVVVVDWTRSGVRFLVTPPRATGGRALAARTTSRFLEEHGLQLAVNGDFFRRWHSNGPFDYYPHTDDPVDVDGVASSNGSLYGSRLAGIATLVLPPDRRARIHGLPLDDAALLSQGTNAISGAPILLLEGRFTEEARAFRHSTELHPRTAVGISRAGDRLILAVVDGRQPSYSDGMTLEELADLLLRHGAWSALNLDGGGSSVLVAADVDGRARLLSTPIHTRIPGCERPVANHLGVFAQPIRPGGR